MEIRTDFDLDEIVLFSVAEAEAPDELAMHQAVLTACLYLSVRKPFEILEDSSSTMLVTFDGQRVGGNEYLVSVLEHHFALYEYILKRVTLPPSASTNTPT